LTLSAKRRKLKPKENKNQSQLAGNKQASECDHITTTLEQSTQISYQLKLSKKQLLVRAMLSPKLWICFTLALVYGSYFITFDTAYFPLKRDYYSQNLSIADCDHKQQNTNGFCSVLPQNKTTVTYESKTTRFVPQNTTLSEIKKLIQNRTLNENDTSFHVFGKIHPVNLSDSTNQSNRQYKNKSWCSKEFFKYQSIVVNSFVFAAGTSCPLNHDCVGDKRKNATAMAFMLQITTGNCFELPRMNEPRIGNALVLFQGRICAVGGSVRPTTECFENSTRKWTYLPLMKKERQNPTAVTIKDELYVIGGMTANQLDLLYYKVDIYINYIFSKTL